LPLDGTVFRDSRSVDSEPFIGTGTIGIAVRHHGFVDKFNAHLFCPHGCVLPRQGRGVGRPA
jgi:hypothetical protein